MKKDISRALTAASLTLAMLFAASCGTGEEDRIDSDILTHSTKETEVVEPSMPKVVVRGTLKEFDGRKLVYFGETTDWEGLSLFACTTLGAPNVTITDAATGQTLTWQDLRDGDYLAVESDGKIAETAPSQMNNVYGITRLSRVSAEATVTAISADGVVLGMADGTSRTVSVDRYYVRGERFDVDSLCVGDAVQLDYNALDESEVYALHLLGREVTVPEGAVTEHYRVTHSHGSEIVLEGDIVIDADQIFFDTDGRLHFMRLNIDPGDLLAITHDGTLTASEPARFGQVYKVCRVAE